jgi:SRSO17 transposase
MAGASIETTLELWTKSLRDVKVRICSPFYPVLGSSVGKPVPGRPVDAERRKTGWMRAEAAGDPVPGASRLFWRGRWDADALRNIVRAYAVEHLTMPEGVLVIGETGFLQQGKASCGVARRYVGSVGKTTNCQIGV